MDTATLKDLTTIKELLVLSKRQSREWAQPTQHDIPALLNEDLTVFGTPEPVDEKEWQEREAHENNIRGMMVSKAVAILDWIVCDNDKTCCPERWENE